MGASWDMPCPEIQSVLGQSISPVIYSKPLSQTMHL
jgi:hypothetical protein